MFSISDHEFKQLASYIKNNYGIDLKDEKRAMIEGRLGKILLQNRISNFSDYLDYVFSDRTGEAVSTLINKITTNHTYFMREPSHFFFMRDKVLPELKKSVKNKDLRIWSAGCSTGEEPYTIAFIIDEFFGMEKALWDAKILATDISARVLKEAVKGVYSGEKVASLPPEWLKKYFIKHESGYEVTDRIKNEVIFRKFNLMDRTLPFKKKFHVIFCRNVMIYFDKQTKIELVKKFYDVMEYGAYLFIGHSESLYGEETALKYIMPSVYRKE